jgi:methyl-accepting chemotaxis protein
MSEEKMRIANLSLKAKTFCGLGILVGILALSTVWTSFLSREVVTEVHLVKNESVVFAGITRKMKLDIFQVQQFLTDISATRARDGLNDGFEKAEKSRRSFLKGVDSFREMFTTEKDQTELAKLNQLEENFNVYYQTGRKMAQAYVDGGPAKGNELMPQFDKAFRAMSESLDPLVAQQNREVDSALHSIVADAGMLRTNLIVTGLIIACTAFLLAWLLFAGIIKPIKNVASSLKDIAEGEGDLTSRLEVTGRDEVGDLAKWFNVFIDKLQRIVKEITAGVETLSLSSTDLSNISQQMSQAAQNASDKSHLVATSSEEMSTNMNNVAAASEQASSNVNIVATATEEMSATINEIAQNSEKARSVTGDAVSQAQNASVKVNELGTAAQEISKVTEVITEISEQTNLLALNATIEAARAGDAGKGFAVVANEIKELAKQTAVATQEIRQKIDGVQSSTGETVGQIKQICEVIDEVNTIVSIIATAVEEQSTATSEIASNVSQAAQGIQEVNVNVAQSSSVAGEISKEIVGVNSSADEIANSSSQVNISAQDLHKLSDRLQQTVTQFKTGAVRFNIGAVKSAHMQWRSRLEGLLRGSHALRPEEVASHHECEFGKWYDSPDGQALKNDAAFAVTGRHHEKVHTYARQIVDLFHDGKSEKAATLMASFETEREKLFAALDELYLC